MLYGGSIPPGRFKGRDVTIQDVFEAVGAHAAGKMTDEELAELEARRQPRRRRLRRPVHRQHDGDGVRGARHLARWARRWSRPQDADARPRSPTRPASSSMDVLKRGLRPRDIITTRRRSRTRSPRSPRAAARPTASCTCWRSPARPASSSTSTTSTAISERTPLLCDLKPGGRYVATDLYEAGGVPVARSSACARPGCSTRTRSRSPARPIGEHRRRGRGDRGPARRARRSTSRSSRPAASRSCAATSRPRAASSSSPATSAASTRARRACSRARRPRWPPSPTAASTAGDVVVIRNEGPAGGPGMREMLARHGGAQRRRAWASTSRCSPTGASPAPRTASWPATSRPRRPAAARSPPSATATRSRSTSTAAASTSTLADDEIAAPRRGLRGAGQRATRPACCEVRDARLERLRGRGHAALSARARRRRSSGDRAPARCRLLRQERLDQRVERRRAARASPRARCRARRPSARPGSAARTRRRRAPGRAGPRRPRRSASGSRSRPRRSRIG